MLECINAYVESPMEKWLSDSCAQLAVTTSQIWWTQDVGSAFALLEQGNESAMKDCAAQLVQKLHVWAGMVLGELTVGERIKLKTIITIDVHARDAVAKLVAERVESISSFAWQSNLKFRWDDALKNWCGTSDDRHATDRVSRCRADHI